MRKTIQSSPVQFAKVPQEQLDKIWHAVRHDYPEDRLHFDMDMRAAEASNPMEWERFANGNQLDILHDVFGILRHLNRQTGKLENHFLPRFSKKTERVTA